MTAHVKEPMLSQTVAMATTAALLAELGIPSSDGGGAQWDRRDDPAHDPSLRPELG